MSGLVATLKHDLRLQARHNLYKIGLFVAVLLGLAGRWALPPAHAGRGLVAFYVLGIGGTTFMFGASMLLLEKGQGTLQALRVSPITTRDYLASKVLTLSAFALAESLVVLGLAGQGAAVSPGPLVAGILTLGAAYTLIGVGLAAGHEAVTSFLLPSGVAVAMVLQLPFLFLLGVGPAALWYAFPTQPALLLMLGAFEPLSAAQWGYAGLYGAGVVGGAYLFCRARFRRFVRLPEAA